jgi:hypothetical protein
LQSDEECKVIFVRKVLTKVEKAGEAPFPASSFVLGKWRNLFSFFICKKTSFKQIKITFSMFIFLFFLKKIE